MFDVGQCYGLVWGLFCIMQLINFFWKIRVVLERTFKCFIAVVLKRANCRQGPTAAAAKCQLTAGKAEARLAAAAALAVVVG